MALNEVAFGASCDRGTLYISKVPACFAAMVPQGLTEMALRAATNSDEDAFAISDAPRWEGGTSAKASWPPTGPQLAPGTPRGPQAYRSEFRTRTSSTSAMLIRLVELKISNCRWPVAEADGEIPFFAEPAENGCPYCAAHTAIAYQPAGRRRIFVQRREAIAPAADGPSYRK